MSFVRKELKMAFLCISVGILALSYPFFVSASGIIAPQTLPYTYEGNVYEEATSYFLPAYNDTFILYCEDSENLIIKAGKNVGFVWACGSGEPHKKALYLYCPNGICGSIVYSETGLGFNALNPPYATCFTNDIILTSQNLLAYHTEDWGGQNCLNEVFENDIILGTNFVSCSLGHCDLCEVWTTCQTAGCSWGCSPDWSGLGCFCEEPVSQPEECGGFYKCQYCETEEACINADITCEWATRGQITKCFTKRPVIPEAQEEWQSCEFDDCNPSPPLGTIEKWICLLKNNLQGIYCPSQETLTDLQHTIETFEEKFPFNYIVAIKEFLNDIKTSLATPKPITISMFGATGTMNFDFLDMPVTIGGVEETMGNIFTDITSIFIYIAFFFWLLAFIRRFF